MVWGVPRKEGQRECEEVRKGREELRHGAGTVPQVPHRQGSGMGGTGKDVGGGVGLQRGREKKGREERKTATEQGRSHRSRTVREVGWEGQEKTWEVSWGEPPQEGQRSSGALPIRSR